MLNLRGAAALSGALPNQDSLALSGAPLGHLDIEGQELSGQGVPPPKGWNTLPGQ